MRQGASDLTHAAHQGGGARRLHVQGEPARARAEDGVEDADPAASFRRRTISRSKSNITSFCIYVMGSLNIPKRILV